MREDILETKIEKLKNIREFGMEAYPEKCERSMTNIEALEQFDGLSAEGKEITLLGRVKSNRPMGGSTFSHIEDGTGKIQIFLNKNNIEPARNATPARNDAATSGEHSVAGGETKYKLFAKNIEIGDFIQVSGKLFKTRQDEKTLEVHDWKVLSKNIRPIPTEYFGLKDEEALLRKRYLDLMMNEETRELFRKKNIFWQTVRQFLVAENFLEVQTPVLEHTPGGADAEPFVTHYNALDQDFYLRISLELPLKRLLVGGYERVFEIGRVFRNEGMDRDHLQEFDHMEFYSAYWDFQKGMEFCEKMFKEIVRNVETGLSVETGFKPVSTDVNQLMITEYENNKIDWSKPFPVVDYFTEFKKETGLDLNADLSAEALRAKADELKIKYEPNYSKGRMIDTIYKKTIRQKLIQPCFLVGHPLEVSPLAKIDLANPKKALRFQIVAGGSELCNAFSELNDPIDQKNRFAQQMVAREGGDKEAQMMDEDFVEALEYGMPPAFGFGMSERLFSFLMNKSIRETVIFPSVRK